MDPRCRESLCHAWSRKGLRGGQYSLKEAYQYMESKVVKGTGNGKHLNDVPKIKRN